MSATRTAFALATAAVLSQTALASGRSMSISRGDAERIESCAQIRMSFHDAETLRGEQVLDIAGSGPIRVEAPENGGVRVQGWDGKGMRARVCKAVADGDSKDLDEIVLVHEGSRLSVRGPDGDDWSAHLVLDVPNGVDVDVAAQNGPVSLVDVSGRAKVETVNGPLSVVRGSGTFTIAATNGPVSLVDLSGEVSADSQNGPLSVKLAPGRWQGSGLDARTQNGPLSLRVPPSYGSGVAVSMSRRAPFRCSDCDDARPVEDGGMKTVTLGSEQPVVRLSTHNGPVSIRSRG
jgi:hypothetical protein